MKSALTIAGSDSGGGAGIQADLKSFAAVGVHGCSVVTCVTAQNTRAVASIFPLPGEEVARQLDAVLSDFAIGAAKTGMLYSAEVVAVVARKLGRRRFPLVVDPVMVATVGASLEAEDFRDALVDELLPRATLVTPNLYEAERLVGFKVKDLPSMRRAARAVVKAGATAALVKGGHLEGPLVDVLYDGEAIHELRAYRHRERVHGSGCALASSVAAYLCQGYELRDAVEAAQKRIAAGFLLAYRAGKGVSVIHSHYVPGRYEVWEEVKTAAEALENLVPLSLAPEVGINVAYALPAATTRQEVCALTGRIVRVGDRLRATGPPAFGASRHVARVVLAAMAYDPRVRSTTNLKYKPKNAGRLRKLGLRVGRFYRKEEPKGVSTMEWGTQQAIERFGRVPDVICDEGAVGKEPMMRVLGRDPRDVLRKVKRIARGLT
jgi:hydroxymethylpyrimidine/phosphomethylpyrimidine kinase